LARALVRSIIYARCRRRSDVPANDVYWSAETRNREPLLHSILNDRLTLRPATPAPYNCATRLCSIICSIAARRSHRTDSRTPATSKYCLNNSILRHNRAALGLARHFLVHTRFTVLITIIIITYNNVIVALVVTLVIINHGDISPKVDQVSYMCICMCLTVLKSYRILNQDFTRSDLIIVIHSGTYIHNLRMIFNFVLYCKGCDSPMNALEGMPKRHEDSTLVILLHMVDNLVKVYSALGNCDVCPIIFKVSFATELCAAPFTYVFSVC
jgi:hypothetical protein